MTDIKVKTDITRKFLDMLTEEDIVLLICCLADKRAVLREIVKGTGKSVEEHLKDPDSRSKLLHAYRSVGFLPTVGAVEVAKKAFKAALGITNE